MNIDLEADRIRISGAAAVEDAEHLIAALLAAPGLPIDLSGLEHAHLAVAQVVRVAGRLIIGWPLDPHLRAVMTSG